MRLVLAALLAVLALPGAAAAQEVDDLFTEPGRYADAEVVLIGELVGDYSDRVDSGVWVQLNTDPYMDAPLLEAGPRGTNSGISVRIPRDLFPDVGEPGGYGRQGPVVHVTGFFRHHDPERGGETYVDATAVRLLEPGRALATGNGWRAGWVGIVLALGSLAEIRRRTIARQESAA